MKIFLAVFFGILAAVFTIWIVGIIIPGWVHENQRNNAARDQAHIAIDAVKAINCKDLSDDGVMEFEDESTKRFQDELDHSTLEIDERNTLEVAFSNALALAGCTPGSRLAQKAEKRRITSAAHPKTARAQTAAQPLPVQVTFQTHPGGAGIYIDDERVGESPVECLVDPGVHKVQLVEMGYKWPIYSIEVRPGQPQEFSWDLEQTIP